MAARLFVGNLSYQTTEGDLRDLFEQVGAVQSVRILTDPATGRPRGFGFVELAAREDAERAIDQLNGRVFRGRNLVVSEARGGAGREPGRGPGGPGAGRGRPGGARPGPR